MRFFLAILALVTAAAITPAQAAVFLLKVDAKQHVYQWNSDGITLEQEIINALGIIDITFETNTNFDLFTPGQAAGVGFVYWGSTSLKFTNPIFGLPTPSDHFVSGNFSSYLSHGITYSIDGPILDFLIDGKSTAIPEPATWIMLLAGFGMIGFLIRQRYLKRMYPLSLDGLDEAMRELSRKR